LDEIDTFRWKSLPPAEVLNYILGEIITATREQDTTKNSWIDVKPVLPCSDNVEASYDNTQKSKIMQYGNWHGTGCHHRSGTISRWNLSSLNSRLICSTALTSTIISIILGWHWYACSRKSRSCNGLVETCYDALEIVWATTTTTTHSSCSVSSTSKQYVLLIFTPRSTNISFVLINLNMPTHTVNDLLKVRSRSIVG